MQVNNGLLVSDEDFFLSLNLTDVCFAADFDVRVAVKANWGIWAVRGKNYNIVVEPDSMWSGGFRGSEES